VLNLTIEQKAEFFTTHFLGSAKVIHRRLRGIDEVLSSPPVNNFGIPIRRKERLMLIC
jgi:Zn-dependent peptidase ImmA (M78 family)